MERGMQGTRCGWDLEAHPTAFAVALSTMLGRCHLSSHGTNRALPWSLIPTNGLGSERQRWQISLKNGYSGS